MLDNYVTGMITKVVIILVLAGFVDFLLRRTLTKISQSGKAGPWATSLAQATAKFSPWIIWGAGIFFSAEVITAETNCMSIDIVAAARNIFLIGALALALLFFKRTVEERLLAETSDVNNRAIIDICSRIGTIAIIVISSLMVLDIFGVPLRALLAFGGLGGLAVSWAAKDVIANFFGGLMIYINRPFFIGDWIKSPNKNFEGVVENIGWYMTQIRTFERRPTYIPNALITDAIVENPGRMYNRRIKTSVGLRYCDIDAVEPVAKEIEQMLKDHPDIDQKQILMVHLIDFGPSCLDIQVYTFTKTTNWARYREVQQDVLLKIAKIVSDNGAELAYPTQTLHLQNDQPGTAPAHS